MLVRTLARVFPQAAVQLCTESESGLRGLSEKPDAVIVHRTMETPTVPDLVKLIRAQDPNVIVLAVSGDDRQKERIFEAGADGFLLYDEWLRAGTVLSDLLRRDKPASDANEMAASA